MMDSKVTERRLLELDEAHDLRAMLSMNPISSISSVPSMPSTAMSVRRNARVTERF